MSTRLIWIACALRLGMSFPLVTVVCPHGELCSTPAAGRLRWASQIGRARRLAAVIVASVLALAAHDGVAAQPASSEPVQLFSPQARPEMVELFRQDLAAQRHPSDGGGRAWIDTKNGDPMTATASKPGRWTVIYEAGPLGVAKGGMIFFLVSPFWGWSTPQSRYPDAPGYTRVTTEAQGVELQTEVPDGQMLVITVAGRALESGETIRIAYGAGPAGAIADRYAEHRSRFWIGVDGDGDGLRSYLPDSPAVDVAPGPPARLVVTLPTVARPGETVRLTLAFLDHAGNAGCPITGDVLFEGVPQGVVGLAPRVKLSSENAGHVTVELAVRDEGTYRLRASGPFGLSAESNPMLVCRECERVWWADLHGHSSFSDGTGTPSDYFAYARDVAGLDVVALTDHDHWGILALDQHPEMWKEIRSQADRFHVPGRFIALFGYEWTSWIHGHRHVLYFEDAGEVFSSIDPRFESPVQLWNAVRGRKAITIAHHSAGGPIATNWSIPPAPALEPVTEVVSVHGASEAADAPNPIYQPVPGNFVRDALNQGYRLGFIGSGDGHDGHPGLAQLAAVSGGLAGIVTDNLTREAVFKALRARRVYATSGPRIFLSVLLDGHPMGSVVKVSQSEKPGVADTPPASTGRISVRVVAPGALDRIELIRSGQVVETVGGNRQYDASVKWNVGNLRAGEYLYVRAVQEDGGAAWSSPIFTE